MEADNLPFFLMTGAVLGLSGGVSPGPLTALVISQTLRFGVREGMLVALAPILTDAPLVILSGAVVASVAHLDSMLGALSLVGAVFLLWLARDSFCAGPLRVDEQVPSEARSVRKSILTNLLNPHPYVFWLLVGGPLVARAFEQGVVALAGFVVGFFACLVGAKLALAVMTERFRFLLESRGYQWVMRGLGVALALFACGFVVDGLERLGIWSLS
jgi:threonine/homoserine/homoserine lactone efflux protein